MKAILISTRPQWVGLILNLIKKDEIRKGTAIGKAINRLIAEQGVAPTFIYCTKDSRKDLASSIINGKRVIAYGSKKNKGLEKFNYQVLNGKVVARFNATAEEINAINLEKFAKDSCLTIRELEDYLWSNILSGTAIHINDLEIFDKPKEISEFHKIDNSNGFICFKCPHFCTDDSAGYSIDSCDLGFLTVFKT